MKRNPLKFGTGILICATLIGAFTLSNAAYSSGSDPLVTLSYLTEVILPQMKQDILMETAVQIDHAQKNDEAEKDSVDSVIMDTPIVPDTVITEATEDGKIPASASYTLLELTAGQKVYAKSVLEMIVRPGSDVRVLSPFEGQGIADITGAKEYLNGETVAINSYLLIPRGDDGRGIEVVNEKSYILVRGEYTIG